MQVNFLYDIGKNGSYESICKHYEYGTERNILKGLKDRNNEDPEYKELLIKLHRKCNFNFINVCLIGIRPLVDYMLNITAGSKNGALKFQSINNIVIAPVNTESENILKTSALNYGLETACRGGHRDIVNLLIQKGANNWNYGLQGACRGGHRDLVDLMIEKGANDWNYGLLNACYGGYMDIVKYMVEKGANDWNSGLQNAIYNGNLDIIKYMVEKGADNLNYTLDIASVHRHWAIVEYLLSTGATNVISKSHTDYYKYLSRKLNKSKPSVHGLYPVLDDLVLLY